MQISFILVEPAVPQNVGYACELSKINLKKFAQVPGANRESFQALNSKIEAVLPKVAFTGSTNIYLRFFERVNYLGEDNIKLLHSVCNKFLNKQKYSTPNVTIAKGFRH